MIAREEVCRQKVSRAATPAIEVCDAPAVAAFTWSDKPESFICAKHLPLLRRTARNKGIRISVRLLTPSKGQVRL